MHGVKGSVKNRIYQFWLIKIFREKKEKRKQKKLEKQKTIEEMRKKVIEEVIGVRETRIWKLNQKTPIVSKKEGTKVTLNPQGKKPPKVIEAYEVQPTIGHIKHTEKRVLKQEPKISPETPKKEYASNQKKDHLAKSPEKIVIPEKKTSHVGKNQNSTLPEQYKKEIEEKIEKENLRVQPSSLRSFSSAKKSEQIRTEKIQLQSKAKEASYELPNLQKKKIEIEKTKISPLSVASTMVVTSTVGTVIVFSGMVARYFSSPKSSLEEKKNEPKKEEKKVEPLKPVKKEEPVLEKKDHVSVKSEPKKDSVKKEALNFKLYRSKIQAKMDAEIIIRAEIERQENYLRQLDKTIEAAKVSEKTERRFRGIKPLFGNLFTFSLGFFALPTMRKRFYFFPTPFISNRFFGTALGLMLINNGVKGMRKNMNHNQNCAYFSWKDFSREIYTEQQAVDRLKDMVDDSLEEIKSFQKDLDREFYGKIPFDDYNDIRSKLKIMELKMIEKQEQIEAMNDELQEQEEKNKVKIRQRDIF